MKKLFEEQEVVLVEGVRNFRGLGGIRIGDKVVKNGLCFRCAKLSKIKEEGVKTLQKLNIRHDFDFRTAQEKKDEPDPSFPFMDLCEFDILGAPNSLLETDRPVSHREFLKNALPMTQLYPMMLNECLPVTKAAFQKAVECLLNNEPFLFHCTEGKDRTGVFAMLILGILGADKKTILDDYLFTNVTSKPIARKRYVFTLTMGVKCARAAYYFSVADADYLGSALDYIDSKGGFEEFAETELGVDKETIRKLREACLA